MRIPLKLGFLLACVSAALAQTPAATQNTTVSGEFTVGPPTLVSLGFEWRITGDDNRNARVETSYRRRGDAQWREGLPLLRLQREEIGAIPRAEVPDRYLLFRYTAPNMFSGSMLNLEPDTEYECRFTLSDPDGVVASPLVTLKADQHAQRKRPS